MGISLKKTRGMISSLYLLARFCTDVLCWFQLLNTHCCFEHLSSTCDGRLIITLSFPLEDEFLGAAELYREVLRSSEEHKGQLKTDSLQVCDLIHVI